MTSLTLRIRNGTFALAIAGALAFGATTARAEPGAARAAGECELYTSSAPACAHVCTEMGYAEWAWISGTRCCYCL
jgi:hypothetical protein